MHLMYSDNISVDVTKFIFDKRFEYKRINIRKLKKDFGLFYFSLLNALIIKRSTHLFRKKTQLYDIISIVFAT